MNNNHMKNQNRDIMIILAWRFKVLSCYSSANDSHLVFGTFSHLLTKSFMEWVCYLNTCDMCLDLVDVIL